MGEVQLKPYKPDIFSFTNKGSRQSNDDRSYHSQLDKYTYLILLADGMGGYTDGHLAAEIAIEEISKELKVKGGSNFHQKIESGFQNAHTAIKDRLHNAGATVGGVLITLDHIFIFWAGDIKINLINGSSSFTSKEHTLLNVLIDAHITIKPEEIARLTHTVVRSLGGDSKSYQPEIVQLPRNGIAKGILYSDGMFPYYSSNDFFKLLTENTSQDLREAFDCSIFNNSKDNVSGIFFYA